MRKAVSITKDLMHLLFLCVPLAILIYIGLHLGLLTYVIYKKIKSICQKTTIK
jgi:hypothetical protein